MAAISYGFAFVGIVKVGFWIAGAVLAYARKRAFLLAGFILAAFSATSRSLTDAGATVPYAITNTFAVLAVFNAFLIVGSFVANQPRGARPRAWTL